MSKEYKIGDKVKTWISHTKQELAEITQISSNGTYWVRLSNGTEKPLLKNDIEPYSGQSQIELSPKIVFHFMRTYDEYINFMKSHESGTFISLVRLDCFTACICLLAGTSIKSHPYIIAEFDRNVKKL